jgi:uncharacterized repeat protein (TIGR03803 family)
LALLALSTAAQSITNTTPTIDTNALPSATAQIQPIYSFTGANGSYPTAGLTVGPDGNFYGITTTGGSANRGTVFRFAIGGPLTTLVSFNGSEPAGALAVGPDDNLYGTTSEGGSAGYGTVFRITTNGTLTTLASFTGANGRYPYAGVAVDQQGNLYGNTEEGGSINYGTVFRVATNGVLTALASFNGANGEYPLYSPLIMGLDGNFYGTTQGGGIYNSGTIFRITPNGTLTTLHSFYINTDGSVPTAGLTVGPDGSFYGTASRGGGGYGTIFHFTTNGTFTTLAYFNRTNGDFPNQLTFGPDGNLYGTAGAGGSIDYGTVFKISTNGNLTALASCTFTTGFEPLGALTLGPDGNFYGTTTHGGSAGVSGQGVVYRLNLPPSIITEPSSQTTLAGSDVTFNVTLFGTAPFAYQWLYNGTPIVGATNSTLSIPDAMPSSDGNYQVIVTNTWGGVTSTVATLSVIGIPPTITNQPAGESVLYGGTANFEAGATGTPPLAYQWLFSSILIADATNSTLSIPDVTLSSGGNYQVIVTSPWGSVTSSIATLSVIVLPPTITNQPASESVLYGGTANFVVGATGTPPLAYQWFFSTIPIPGATNSTLSVPNITLSSAGDYQVIVTSPWGSVTSSIATLSVIPVPPTITKQPANQSVRNGGTATFAVGATGTPPLAYQWYFYRHKRQELLPGATNSILSFGPVHPNQEGNYQVIVTSPYGSATSDVASLTVLTGFNIYAISNSGPGSMTLRLAGAPGSTYRLWATANPKLPFGQWQPIATNTVDATGLSQFIDTNTSGTSAKFYILSSP